MNPPFSVVSNLDRSVANTTLRHIRSVLARLGVGGRLVVIKGLSFSPDDPSWTDAFIGSGKEPGGDVRASARSSIGVGVISTGSSS
ncbi:MULTISPECIES: hypothetical protein [unclassified Bradyrhizobium]|uniref:hypothetical protein n=1 Tax=unclassified Bradyrhizobium TaxID=2631580 RepID=UPI0028EAFE25|nr:MULTISPECIES: hypothetical protein [unclassified Bradyrhizobium]